MARAREVAGRYRPWVAATTAATISTVVLRAAGFDGFERFFGPLPPAATMAALGAAGLGALAFLEGRRFWHRPTHSGTVRGMVVATGAALPFAAIAIAADALGRFPQDTNVGWPEAWLFYPAIAVAAEALFHLLPLAGLTWATRSHLHARPLDGRTLGLILAVAAVEPLAQVALGTALPAFTAVHVYLIGVVGLILLRRYGYVSMLWFRVCYYLLWHVLWGAARLELLF